VNRLKLDSRKAIEAAAILARLSPGRKISRKRLLALLYIASRECLKRSGRPLLGGTLVAMKYGPINARVYDLITEKEGAEGSADWARHFHNEGYHLVLDEDPGVNALSRFEARLLEETLRKHEKDDDWDVTWLTHKFPEYGQTYRPQSRPRAIPLEAIIGAVRLGPMAKSIERDLKEQDELDELFASAGESARKPR
jgi:uncharacterized phage-associated protein